VEALASVASRLVQSCLSGLKPATQNFRHTPSLRYTATRQEGRLSVKDLADGTDASIVFMPNKPFQKGARARRIFWMDFQPCIYIRSDQPGPYRALMISCIASGMPGRSRSSAVNALCLPGVVKADTRKPRPELAIWSWF
jgi:hypothetical protein